MVRTDEPAAYIHDLHQSNYRSLLGIHPFEFPTATDALAIYRHQKNPMHLTEPLYRLRQFYLRPHPQPVLDCLIHY